MKYALALLTHGDNAEVLGRTIQAFEQYVSPPPVVSFLYQDGPSSLPPFLPYPLISSPVDEQRGYCIATAALWSMVANSEEDFDYVFWLENDFEIFETIDLCPMAEQLDMDSDLVQMSLMRDAVSPAEIAAGGLFESRPGQYEQQWTNSPYRAEAYPWLRHHSYLTTNPSLMTRAFMLENPWPAYKRECEGLFGIDLVAAGRYFGVWGSGEPMCRHIGTRTGHGY